MSNIQKNNSEITEFVKFIHNKGEVKAFLEDIHLITLNVAGLYYAENIDEIFPKIKKGDILDLFREKDNVHDKYAILVKYSGDKIGHVPRKHNRILANMMDGGKELYGVVEDIFTDGAVYEPDEFKVIIFKIFLKE
ncbi:MAG: HIRAN domain-containing protein [Methanobrevibacter sp.]|nr:HIRAN domain-containing protein [Methanobrevibacter sp.]